MAESFSNDNIDPRLLALDPTNNILARIRNGTARPSEAPSPRDEDMDNEEDLDLPLGPSNNDNGGTPSLVAYGRLVKRKLNLSETVAVALDQFCQVNLWIQCELVMLNAFIVQAGSAEERQVLLCAHVLELVELCRKNEKAETWSISPELAVRNNTILRALLLTHATQKKINSYVRAFVFSPTTISYRGLNVSEHILVRLTPLLSHLPR